MSWYNIKISLDTCSNKWNLFTQVQIGGGGIKADIGCFRLYQINPEIAIVSPLQRSILNCSF